MPIFKEWSKFEKWPKILRHSQRGEEQLFFAEKVPIPIKRKRARVHHRGGEWREGLICLVLSERRPDHRNTATAETERQKDREFFAFSHAISA